MTNFRRIFAAGAVLLVAMLAAQPVLAQQENLVDTIKKRGKLQAGFSSFVPWAMRDKQGQWVGFEIDVMNKLAKDEMIKGKHTTLDDMTRAIDAVTFTQMERVAQELLDEKSMAVRTQKISQRCSRVQEAVVKSAK